MNEKMSYDDFKKAVVEEIKDFLPPSYQDWEIGVKKIYKVNFAQEVLMLAPPKAKAKDKIWRTPTIYLENYYEKFQSGEIFSSILKQIAKNITMYTMQMETKKEFFKVNEEKIVFQIINREKNKELLKTLPHREILDLALIYRIIRIQDKGEMISCAVTYDLLKELKLSEEELYDYAKKRTDELLKPEMVAVMPPLYALTNKKLVWGAASVMFPEKLKELANTLKKDLYLLPSSLDEMMVIPTDYMPAEQVHDILLQANKEAVTEEEWLSDRLYIYMKDSNEIHFAHDNSPEAYMS